MYRHRRCRDSLVALAVIALVGSAAATVRAQSPLGLAAGGSELEQRVTKLVDERGPTVVSIARIATGAERIAQNPFDPFPRFQPAGGTDGGLPADAVMPNDFGAGVLVSLPDDDGQPVVLTNHHVVRGGPVVGDDGPGRFRLVVHLASRHRVEARILAADPRSDLAALELDLAGTGLDAGELPSVALDTPVELDRGRFVVAFGNPYAIARDGTASASFGMVANRRRRPAPAGPPLDEDTRRRETIHHFGTLLQIDARLDIGFSGGPLFDLDGHLAGITTSMAALEGYEKSAGYAIALDEPMLRAVRDLAQGYEVEYGFLGVVPTDVAQKELAQLPVHVNQPTAARVEQVFPSSPSSRGLTREGGLLPRDVVLAVRSVGRRNGERVTVYDKHDLMREVGLMPPGSVAELTVWRPHERRQLNVRVRLGKWPVEDDEGIVATNTRYPKWRGITVDHPTARRRYFGKPYVFHEAVLVTDVDPDATVRDPATARPRELVPGTFVTHVNDTPVDTPERFHEITRDLTGPAVLRSLGGDRYEVE